MATDTLLHVENYIDGKFSRAADGRHLDSFDPSTGSVWATIPDSDVSDVERAVSAAQRAFRGWTETPVEQRSALLLRLADLLESQLDEFAAAESRDQGKPVWLARSLDIPRAVYNCRCFASALPHHVDTSRYVQSSSSLNYTERNAVGVAALVSPWNLPLYLLTFKMAPALACGNTVVCKPSEMTSVTAWMLCRLIQQAGFPAGVVNMVFGTGAKAGQALTGHPGTSLISFTGSTATAQKIRLASAPYCKKLSLELGGKNPGIIFADADLDKCVPTTIRSSFINQGEICLCTSRLFVQSAIFDKFLTKFVDAAKKIKVGDPRDGETWMGPLVSKEHEQKVRSYLKTAQDEGLKFCCGETVQALALPAACQKGYFVQPTVIVNAPDSSVLMQDEIFGPVVCVVPFDSEAEVVERANNVKYGLCATVWTSDVNKAHRVARKLEAGTVWINCWMVRDLHMPFGGVKSSGTGREGVTESIEFYTEVKTTCLQLAAT